VISEYDGEARLVQEPEPSEVLAHDVIFLCESGGISGKLTGDGSPKPLVIDLVGGAPEKDPQPLIHMDFNPDAARDHDGRLSVPHPISILLAELLGPLDRELGVTEAVSVILRPAADFGEAGVEELREQTVRLLNFIEIPVATFGRQLAFNVIPQAELDCDSHELEQRISQDVARLLGWERRRLTLRLLAAPVFFGHCLQLRLRFREGASASRIETILKDRTISLPSASRGGSTPMDVSDQKRTSLYEIADDGLGGFWLMAVAGEAGGKGAEQAVRLADSLCRL
jgi:aspartate-semialdehyde dehydrogenase